MVNRNIRGNALVETTVALVALLPFLGGIVLLGKQLDLKHKTLDALRYSVWERTVWNGSGANAKSEADIATEAVDRSFGDPSTGLLSVDALRSTGVSRNSLWTYRGQSLLAGSASSAIAVQLNESASPVAAGHVLMPGLAHGSGPAGVAASALRMDDLGLTHRAYARASIETNIRPLLHGERAAPLSQRAVGAILSDTWAPRDENELGGRVDRITANELIQTLELPGRPIALQSLGEGGPLYGEGRYASEVQLRPRSNALPAAYVTDREGE